MRRHMGLTANFRFKATPGLRAAMWKAADRDHTNASEFVRRAILEKLRELGLDPSGERNTSEPAAS
jgi:hypothetical protein